MVTAIKNGYDGTEENKRWSFAGAFLYSLTVITTIGEFTFPYTLSMSSLQLEYSWHVVHLAVSFSFSYFFTMLLRQQICPKKWGSQCGTNCARLQNILRIFAYVQERVAAISLGPGLVFNEPRLTKNLQKHMARNDTLGNEDIQKFNLNSTISRFSISNRCQAVSSSVSGWKITLVHGRQPTSCESYAREFVRPEIN